MPQMAPLFEDKKKRESSTSNSFYRGNKRAIATEFFNNNELISNKSTRPLSKSGPNRSHEGSQKAVNGRPGGRSGFFRRIIMSS
jgi:hypothetical protein